MQGRWQQRQPGVTHRRCHMGAHGAIGRERPPRVDAIEDVGDLEAAPVASSTEDGVRHPLVDVRLRDPAENHKDLVQRHL